MPNAVKMLVTQHESIVFVIRTELLYMIG